MLTDADVLGWGEAMTEAEARAYVTERLPSLQRDWRLEDLLAALRARGLCWALENQWRGWSMPGRGAWAEVWFYIWGKVQGPFPSDPSDDALTPLGAMTIAAALALREEASDAK